MLKNQSIKPQGKKTKVTKTDIWAQQQTGNSAIPEQRDLYKGFKVTLNQGGMTNGQGQVRISVSNNV